MIESQAIKKGIFVQQVQRQKRTLGYCVTFPMLSNVLGVELDGVAIFPSETFRTFSEALIEARRVRNIIGPLRKCPIYSLQFSWRKDYFANRILQEVEK